jgi:hypothetical protein
VGFATVLARLYRHCVLYQQCSLLWCVLRVVLLQVSRLPPALRPPLALRLLWPPCPPAVMPSKQEGQQELQQHTSSRCSTKSSSSSSQQARVCCC